MKITTKKNRGIKEHFVEINRSEVSALDYIREALIEQISCNDNFSQKMNNEIVGDILSVLDTEEGGLIYVKK